MPNYGVGILSSNNQQESPKSILICRTDRMGDVVLALPTARALKLTYPDAKVMFLCRKYTASVVTMCSWLDGVIEIDRPKNVVLDEIRRYQFDMAVCLWQSLEVIRLLVRAGIPVRVGPGTRLQSIWFHRRWFEHRKWGIRHEVFYNLNIARLAGVKGVPEPLWEFKVPEEADTRITMLLAEVGVESDSKLVVLHPVSGESAKDWSLESFAKLAERLHSEGLSVLLTGSEAERHLVQGVSDYAAGIPNLAGKLSIPELAALFQRSDLVIANSTGPIHLANALGAPVVGLYPLGRSMHPNRWGPLGQIDRVLTPVSADDSMASISVDKVFGFAREVISQDRKSVAIGHRVPPLSVLITITSPWWNAATYLAVGLATGLRDRGHQVWLMGRPGTPALERASELGLETIGLPLHKQDPVSVARNVIRIRAILSELPVTLVNAHCPMGHSQVAAALYGLGRNTPLVRSVCDPRPPKGHALNRWLHERGTDWVVVTCEGSRQRYLDAFSGIGDKISVIPGGIDPVPFQDLYSESGEDSGREVWVGIVCRLSPVKGHDVFLRAAAEVAVKAPDARFLISGESAQISHDDLQRMAISSGIEDRVKIEDQADDVRDVLRRLDIGVVASTGSEVMCRIALEMMAAGLPVIGTDVNAVGESIVDGVTGVVIPPNDPNRLAEAMLQLIDNANLRKSMGEAGRDRVVQELSMARMVERTEELYNKVLGLHTSEYMPVIGSIS